MATYVYDDYRVTLRPREDGSYEAQAVGTDGTVHAGTFRLPFTDDELEQAVLGVARHGPTRRTATRDVGGATGAAPPVDAERLGGTLADALLSGDIATGYDDARRRAVAAGRGMRLSLSLAEAPKLLSVPWELLYRRPRFLANQRSMPLVRHLAVPDLPRPPEIHATVRILGVVSSPDDCAPLDVAAERARVQHAVAGVADRVELDWLEPATPRRLREALRDGTYHVLHYVGHSDFKTDGDGVLYLDDGAGGHAEVDSTELANLLADQATLRLVVLNSCEGARTTLTDAYAGVATTLVHLGVPAVVAMQFEISDDAAILFAEELYTNLIGRQAPIDAAVGEARKALYIELGGVEWATPVLFMGDVDVELFHFEVAPVAPPPPALPPPAPPRAETEAEPDARPTPRRRWRAAAIAVAGALVSVVVLLGVLGVKGALTGDEQAGAPAPTVATTSPAAPGTVVDRRDTAAAPTSFEGEIERRGQTVEHPVELSAGQIVYLRGTTACGPTVEYRLLSPSGTQVGGAPYACNDLGRIEIAETGTWNVVVADSLQGTGPYAIDLLPIPADQVTEIEIGDTLGGEIQTPGERHQYQFDAHANDIVYLRGDGPCGAEVVYRLLSPSGTPLGGAPYACDDGGRYVLAETGRFTVEVGSYDGGGGVYEIGLLRVRPDNSQRVTIGGRLDGEIAGPGEVDLFTFRGNAGESVALDGVGPCGAGAAMRLLTPSGAQLGGVPYACGDLERQELPENGLYSVVVESYAGGTGIYEIVLRRG